MDSITTGLATSTLDGKKFEIQQSIPSGSIKKGPHTIVRSAHLNDGIAIIRRFGEGSKPLFDRDHIAVTASDARDTGSGHECNAGCKTKSNQRSSSTKSSSPERYRHRDTKKHSSPISGRRKSPERSSRSERPNHNHDKLAHTVKYNNIKTDKCKIKLKIKSRSPSPTKEKPVEKVPYYRDQQREKDRLRRLYGRSRSRTPPRHTAKKYSPLANRRIASPTRRRRRSTSRERYRKHSPYRNLLRRDYRSRRSRTRSRTRSPQRRDRHKHYFRSSRERDNEHKDDPNVLATAIIPTTPQFIPIPVAVPADYAAYSFPGWTAPQPSWHPSLHRPPPASHFAPFTMMPMMPPMRPPHQTAYGGMPPNLPYAPITASYRTHAPQRYPPPRHNTNYQSRPKKPFS
ncbi:female-specific protein transformer-like [Calliphora vicina]|uniref:female-specific protein transformer-like n=1 Tax=Calliphora vicina TaxID=7373 RepID=UPI00325A6230